MGSTFSNQIASSNVDAEFWLVYRPILGIRRCVVVGKYPNEFENLNRFEECLNFRFCAVRFSSSARMKPKIVTVRAVILR